MTGRPLAGRRVVVTRQQPGELGDRLAQLGADVVHVPLIDTIDPADDGVALRDALDRLADHAWLIVTSPTGSERVVAMAADDLAASGVKIAAVGRATAAVVERAIGRPVDLVPAVQRLDGLVAEFPPRPAGNHGADGVLAARADRADPTLADRLQPLGWRVHDVVAYRTIARRPDAADRERVAGADAILFASGSAVQSWAEAFGASSTEGSSAPAVVVIGPSTQAVARQVGVAVTAVAVEQSIDGLVDALVTTLGPGA